MVFTHLCTDLNLTIYLGRQSMNVSFKYEYMGKKHMDAGTLLCDVCKLVKPVGEIKYMVKGKGHVSVCAACREKKGGQAGTTSTGKSAHTQPLSEGKTQYMCERCRYKFSSYPKYSTPTVPCPYCGKTDKVVKFSVLSSKELLGE